MRDGNVCGCGRMIFKLSDICFTDPEDQKITFKLPDIAIAECLGCGNQNLIGLGTYRFVPEPVRSTVGKELLRDSVRNFLQFKNVKATSVRSEPKLEVVDVGRSE